MLSKRIALFAGAALTLAAGALPVLAQPAPGPGPGGPPRAGHGFALGEAFARADVDNDGRVTRDEGWAWLQARFQEVDADRDGGVSMEEMRAFATARMGGRGPRRGMEQGAQGMFRALDVNSDGKVTLEEIRPFAEAMFRARDVNSDGALTREEVRPRHRGPRPGEHPHRGPADRGGPPPAAPAN
ncbi:EF-hand domain-containing protein [Falsiroseomonas sp.]|uniref:EF-hand domain-containing protein n=1 Tax=Falsiroseomonas sp. TaxID=2870721 RepID=UPI003F721D3E